MDMYRVSHLLAELGWVDLNLGSSPGWWAAPVDTFCPSRMVEHPKSKSTQPRFVRRWDTLYYCGTGFPDASNCHRQFDKRAMTPLAKS